MVLPRRVLGASWAACPRLGTPSWVRDSSCGYASLNKNDPGMVWARPWKVLNTVWAVRGWFGDVLGELWTRWGKGTSLVTNGMRKANPALARTTVRPWLPLASVWSAMAGTGYPFVGRFLADVFSLPLK